MMTIELGNKRRVKIIRAVIGQLSDGKWENSPGMNKYWRNCQTQGTDLIIDNDRWDSGFSGKTEDWIRRWFAGKLKAVVQDEVGNNKQGWSRDNMEISYYISYNRDMTVSHCYECYDFLLGRTGHTYAFQAPANAPGMKEYKTAISNSIKRSCQNLNIITDTSSFDNWVLSILDYYEKEFKPLTNQGFDENYFNELNQNVSPNEKWELAWPDYTAAAKMLQYMFYDKSDYLKTVTDQYGTTMAADDCFRALYFVTFRAKMLQDIYNHFKTT